MIAFEKKSFAPAKEPEKKPDPPKEVEKKPAAYVKPAPQKEESSFFFFKGKIK